MIYRYILLFFVFNIAINISAQVFSFRNIEFYKDTSDYSQLNTNFSLYYHAGIKPGLSIGFEIPRNGVVRNKSNKSNSENVKSILWQTMILANSGIYYHRKNHTGFFINGIYCLRRTNHKGWQLDAGAGFGFLKTFLPKTYEYTEAGLEKVFLPGRLFLTNNYEISIGKRFNINNTPVYVFTRHNFYMMVPYNQFVNFGYSIEWGARLKLFNNPFN